MTARERNKAEAARFSTPVDKWMRATWEFAGWQAAMISTAQVRSDIDAWAAEARAAKDYVTSDRLRALANRLNTAVSYPRPDLARDHVNRNQDRRNDRV